MTTRVTCLQRGEGAHQGPLAFNFIVKLTGVAVVRGSQRTPGCSGRGPRGTRDVNFAIKLSPRALCQRASAQKHPGGCGSAWLCQRRQVASLADPERTGCHWVSGFWHVPSSEGAGIRGGPTLTGLGGRLGHECCSEKGQTRYLATWGWGL